MRKKTKTKGINVDVICKDYNEYYNLCTGKKGTTISEIIRNGKKTFLSKVRNSYNGFSFSLPTKDCLEIKTFFLTPKKNACSEWHLKNRLLIKKVGKKFIPSSQDLYFLEELRDTDIDLLCGESILNIETFFGAKSFYEVDGNSFYCFSDIHATVKYIYGVLGKYPRFPYSLGIKEMGKPQNEKVEVNSIPLLFKKRVKILLSKKIRGGEDLNGLEYLNIFSIPSFSTDISKMLYSFIENHGETSIVRIFRVSYNAPYKNIRGEGYVEVERIFINKASIEEFKNSMPLYPKSLFMCYDKNGISTSPLRWIESALKNAANNTKTKISCGNIPQDNWIEKFILMLQSPVVEKIYKSGYKSLSDFVFESVPEQRTSNCNKEGLSEIEKKVFLTVGETKNKGKFHQQIGIPEYLLKISNNKSRYEIALIFDIKKAFKKCPEYFLRMNSEDLLFIYNLFKKTRKGCFSNSAVIETLSKMFELYGPKNIKGYAIYILKNIEEDTFSTYSEYVDRIYALKDVSKFDWKLSGEALTIANESIYDAYMMATNDLIYMQYVQGMKERESSLASYEFKGKEFSVSVPKNPGELVMEGSRLHHCVKTYMKAVSQGETTILFVRKTKNPETPFLTLEIRNNEVRQCHGANNSKIEEGSTACKFIKNYCKQKNIKWSNPDRILAV